MIGSLALGHCYHAVRRNTPEHYVPAAARQLASGGRGLILAGNAREPHDPGWLRRRLCPEPHSAGPKLRRAETLQSIATEGLRKILTVASFVKDLDCASLDSNGVVGTRYTRGTRSWPIARTLKINDND